MRFDHTMIRVFDLDRSLRFYTDVMGMHLIRKKDYPHGKFTLAFVGYSEEQAQLELTHNWEQQEPYNLGSGYGHIAIIVEDIHAICAQIKEKGGKIPRPPGPMKGSTSLLAFVEDPDGYKIELIQKGAAAGYATDAQPT
ncbi:MAG: lactoylglutathione lyase [Simkaniaceae bacterium]|nr:lactoylglutathione lyase [Simkaniaceae bacterium]